MIADNVSAYKRLLAQDRQHIRQAAEEDVVMAIGGSFFYRVPGGSITIMQHEGKCQLKEFYEDEAEHLSHQEMMYLRGKNYELWWHRKRLSYVMSYLSEIFKESQIRTFVDVGCAEGFYMKCVASSHSETFRIGADVARTYVRKAKTYVNNPSSDYTVCDIERLPLRNGAIDIVLCSEVREHIYDYLGSLSELNRARKKYLML